MFNIFYAVIIPCSNFFVQRGGHDKKIGAVEKIHDAVVVYANNHTSSVLPCQFIPFNCIKLWQILQSFFRKKLIFCPYF